MELTKLLSGGGGDKLDGKGLPKSYSLSNINRMVKSRRNV
jgi:hypothetical protein